MAQSNEKLDLETINQKLSVRKKEEQLRLSRGETLAEIVLWLTLKKSVFVVVIHSDL